MSLPVQLKLLATHAQASYAATPPSATTQQFANALQEADGGFTSTQAQHFASHHTVILQYNDDTSPTGNGTSLSLTVFKDLQGQLTLALRGTLEAQDLLTDANIFLRGAGYDQIAALYNWWQRASTPAGQAVAQYRVQPIEFEGTEPTPTVVPLYSLPSMGSNQVMALVRVADATATGDVLTALASDADLRLDVAGHSLGGHLAMAFGALFGPATASVSAFNAPGFTDTLVNQRFFSRLGGSVPTEASIGHLTTNVIANHTSAADVLRGEIGSDTNAAGSSVSFDPHTDELSARTGWLRPGAEAAAMAQRDAAKATKGIAWLD